MKYLFTLFVLALSLNGRLTFADDREAVDALMASLPDMILQAQDDGSCETYEEDCERGQEDEDGDGHPDNPNDPENPVP